MGKVIGFGEIMVRLQPPGYLRLMQAGSFDVSFAGAEANVLVSVSRFGLETEYVTKLPKNDMSEALLSRLLMHRVGIENVVFGGDRIGLYYLERGASQRPSKVIYDRKYSSIAMARREDFDWEKILDGADWFHFTGITPALGEELPAICIDACKVAKRKGVTISCDLNYRSTMWSRERAREVFSEIAPYVDVLVGNEEDAEACLGIVPEESDITGGKLNYDSYVRTAERIVGKYGTKTVAFTLRGSISASDNRWAAMLYEDGKAYFSKEYLIHIVDRVGGGDSFGGALIYALIKDYEPQRAVDFAVAASCLKQTMEMDFNLSTVAEVHRLMDGDGSGRVQR